LEKRKDLGAPPQTPPGIRSPDPGEIPLREISESRGKNEAKREFEEMESWERSSKFEAKRSVRA